MDKFKLSVESPQPPRQPCLSSRWPGYYEEKPGSCYNEDMGRIGTILQRARYPHNKSRAQYEGDDMKKYILNVDENIDAAYQRICGEEGLFCKAFFGHKKTEKESRKLNRIYKSLHAQFVKRNTGLII